MTDRAIPSATAPTEFDGWWIKNCIERGIPPSSSTKEIARWGWDGARANPPSVALSTPADKDALLAINAEALAEIKAVVDGEHPDIDRVHEIVYGAIDEIGKLPSARPTIEEHREHKACPSHCCPRHGCKYGYEDCPVATGKVQPKYPKNNGCESCECDTPSTARDTAPIIHAHRSFEWEKGECYPTVKVRLKPDAWKERDALAESLSPSSATGAKDG